LKLDVPRFLPLLAAGLLLAVLVVGKTQPAPALAQEGEPPFRLPSTGVEVDSSLLAAFESEPNVDYVIVMDEQADLSAAYRIEDWDERGRYVYETLKATAERSQAQIIAELERRGVAYQSFMAGNEIFVYGSSRSTLQSVLQMDGIAKARAPVEVRLAVGFSLPQFGPYPQTETQPSIAWGLKNSQAVDFWATYTLRGEGIWVANIDTGVEYDHPALAAAYRCAGADPGSPICWFDPTVICPPGKPCDNHGHGTHTMGTMVGSHAQDLLHTVGMAPAAEWIACKGCENDICSDVSLQACADWILAPGGDPSNRPHVVNNSWGGEGGDDWFQDEVTAWRAAGIFPVFAAGNRGLTCSSMGSPADYPESFAVANHTLGGSIADTSSRGPSIYGDNPYTKPNLSAPGTDVMSSFRSRSWKSLSGTSMAAPHVAGAVALLWACSPLLVGEIDETFRLLQDTPGAAPLDTSCGIPPSGAGNYTYGYGYLNVLKAGNETCSLGTLSGTVTHSANGLPLAGAQITATGDRISRTALTDMNGKYRMIIGASSYSVTASKAGFSSTSISNQTIPLNGEVVSDFELTPHPPRVWLPIIHK